MTSSESPTSPRELIARSALALFEAHGYAGVSVRGIAADAGVDPSLVIRHFGSKEALFIKVVGLDGYADPPIAGPVEHLGQRLAAFALAPEQSEYRSRLSAMIRASDREAVREGLRLTIRRVFVDQLVAVLAGEDQEVRAQLISAQLGGLVQAADAVETEMLALVSRERLIELYGRAIQSLVDG